MRYSGGCSRDMSWRKWGEQQRRRFETAEQRSAVPAAESVPLTLTSEGCFKVAPLVHISDTAHTGRLPCARFNYRSKDYKLRIKWNCNRKLAMLELGWGTGGGEWEPSKKKSSGSHLAQGWERARTAPQLFIILQQTQNFSQAWKMWNKILSFGFSFQTSSGLLCHPQNICKQ